MPIVNKKPSAPSDIKPIIPRIEPEENKSVVVDTKYTPRSSLLKYVEGAPWDVDYFSQVHNKDNATYSQDPGQLALYQQYKRIEHLQLRVESPLTSQQDQDTKGFVVKGAALLPLSVIPNEGDMFVADVGDGREGVFQIDNSEKRSIFKEAVYYIEYTMLYYSDSEKERYNDLLNKVVQNLHYVKEFAQYGQNALVTTERLNTYKEIGYHYKRLKAQYFQWFYSKEFATLILPGQIEPTYDSYVVKAIQSLYLTNDVYEFRAMRALNIEDDLYLKRPTIWDALLQRDEIILETCEQQVGLASVLEFQNDPMMETIRYSGLNYIVYPKILNDAVDQSWSISKKPIGVSTLTSVSTLYGNLDQITQDETYTYLGKQIPIVTPVTQDDYYVFSQAFYEDKEDKSLIEILARSYIEKKANDPVLVLKLLNSCWRWGGLERFYYIPVLMILASNIIKDL